MPNTQIGTYHLADNPQLFEIQRQNNFEFIVTDIDDIQRAGTIGTESNAKIKNAQEMLRLSVTKAFVPHFKQETVQVKRGNTTLKYAGVPSFDAGSLDFNDFIGADVKSKENLDGIDLHTINDNDDILVSKINDFYDNVFSNIFKEFDNVDKNSVAIYSVMQEWHLDYLKNKIYNLIF